MSSRSRNHTCDSGSYGPCDACELEARGERLCQAMRRINIPLLRKLLAVTTAPNLFERPGWLEIEKAKEAGRWELLQTMPLLLDALEAYAGPVAMKEAGP